MFHRLLLSVLVAVSMVAGFGRASSAAPECSVTDQHAPGMEMPAAPHAGQMMRVPAHSQPVSPNHHDLAGCASCSMACCSLVLPSLAVVSAPHRRVAVAYALRLASEHGVIAAIEPHPPRPSTL